MDRTRKTRIVSRLLGLALGVAALLAVGCAAATRDRAVVYTEQGMEAAELRWDAHYRARLDSCARRFAPRTPEAAACFGPTYRADEAVAAVVHGVVALLRAYWTARAADEPADWIAVARQVQVLLAGLPPEARDFFRKVEGLR